MWSRILSYGCRRSWWFTRLPAMVLAAGLVGAALGCREDVESPMGPEAESALAPAAVEAPTFTAIL